MWIRNTYWLGIGLLLFAFPGWTKPGWTKDDVPGVAVSVLITVESKSGTSPTLNRDSLRIEENKQARQIVELKPLRGAASQLLILIDDSAGGGFNNQIEDIRKFVAALPENVEVGVGYMRNGFSQMASEFTKDHAQAAKSIRLAAGLGGTDVSPYDSLSDAVKKWPRKSDAVRREVIMISSGLEGLGGGLPPENPYVNTSIGDAVKAGVLVYAIYNPGSGHEGHSFWRGNAGQSLLSQLADETGGELYATGFGSAVSFEPFLTDILKRQSQQYLLTFEAKAEKKSGLQPVKISLDDRGMSVAAPTRIYVKASL